MRKFYLIILSVFISLCLTACFGDSLSDYKKALEKTDTVTKGKKSVEFTVNMDFNTEGMDAEDIKELNYLKNTEGNFNATFDNEQKKGIYKNYINIDGIGFDSDLYLNGDKIYLKLPVNSKYIKIEDEDNRELNKEKDNKFQLFTQETLENLESIWRGLMKKEDVFRKKNIVRSTPDGEVKTTEYDINLEDEQVKSLISQTLNIISKDEKTKKFYDDYIKEKLNSKEDKSFQDIILKAEESTKYYEIKKFHYTAYVDIDGYIVNETVEFKLYIKNTEKSDLKAFDYKLDIKRWDINKDQTFDFPKITDDNTCGIKDMKSKFPFIDESFTN